MSYFAQSFMGSGIFPIFVVVVAVLGIIGGWYWEKKRTEKIIAFAQQRGLSYEKRNDYWVELDLGYPSGVGHSHRAKHVMTGSHEGRPITVFEHQWVTGSGKERQTHQAMVSVTQLPRAFPKLQVGHEGVFSRVARRMGVKDIELESEDFNRQFKVEGDRRLAYDVLHPRLMQWLLASSAPGFTINGPFVAVTFNGRLQLEQLDGNIAYLDAVIDQLPSFIWSK